MIAMIVNHLGAGWRRDSADYEPPPPPVARPEAPTLTSPSAPGVPAAEVAGTNRLREKLANAWRKESK